MISKIIHSGFIFSMYFYPFQKVFRNISLVIPLSEDFFEGKPITPENWNKIKDIFENYLQEPITLIEKPHSQWVSAGKSFKNSAIIITPKTFDDLQALRGILKHEILHIKKNHNIKEMLLSTAVTLSTSIIVRAYFECSVFVSMIAPIIADLFFTSILKHYHEKEADDYCLDHITIDEFKGVLRSLEVLEENFSNRFEGLPDSPQKRKQRFQNAYFKLEGQNYEPTKEELIPLKNAFAQALGIQDQEVNKKE